MEQHRKAKDYGGITVDEFLKTLPTNNHELMRDYFKTVDVNEFVKIILILKRLMVLYCIRLIQILSKQVKKKSH